MDRYAGPRVRRASGRTARAPCERPVRACAVRAAGRPACAPCEGAHLSCCCRRSILISARSSSCFTFHVCVSQIGFLHLKFFCRSIASITDRSNVSDWPMLCGRHDDDRHGKSGTAGAQGLKSDLDWQSLKVFWLLRSPIGMLLSWQAFWCLATRFISINARGDCQFNYYPERRFAFLQHERAVLCPDILQYERDVRL